MNLLSQFIRATVAAQVVQAGVAAVGGSASRRLYVFHLVTAKGETVMALQTLRILQDNQGRNTPLSTKTSCAGFLDIAPFNFACLIVPKDHHHSVTTSFMEYLARMMA